MLVRGASATPEAPAFASTPPAARKRKHAVLGADDTDPDAALTPDAARAHDAALAPDIVLARDTSRPRLTVSRHPVFPAPGADDASPFQVPELCAVNRTLDKVGFKYAPAGVAAPGAAVPYRTIESAPCGTRASWEDRSAALRVTPDARGLAGAKGFRSARANVGVQEGRWYMEVRVERGGGDGAHVRLGWGRREAPLNGPVGLDGYSYGVRDRTGERVTLSRPRPYGRAFGAGDVVGLYIALPPRRAPDPRDPDDPAHVRRERIAIDFKGQEYFESLDYPQSKEMLALMEHPSKAAKADPPPLKKSATVKNLPSERGRPAPAPPKPAPQRPLPTLPGSQIAFFVNGECQGPAFRDLYDFLQLRPPPDARRAARDKQPRRSSNRDGPCEHTEHHFDDGTLGYYPFFSLFGDAQVRLNPGPDFAFPPPPDVDAVLAGAAPAGGARTWRPMSERYPEFMAQQWALDAKEEAEARGEPAEPPPVVDAAQEEKIRQKRERKRKSEAARRKRLKDEKIAAAAAAAAAAALGAAHPPDVLLVPYPVPGSSPAPGAFPGSSPAPSLAQSLAASAGTDLDAGDPRFAATVRSTPASSPVKDHSEAAPVDIMRDTSVPQTPQSSDFGGAVQQEHWHDDDGDDELVALQLEPKQEELDAEPLAQNSPERMMPGPPPTPQLGFEESSTRWTGQ